jgi:hypothetical protein
MRQVDVTMTRQLASLTQRAYDVLNKRGYGPRSMPPYEVTETLYPAGERLTLVSGRNGILMGLRPSSFVLSHPQAVHSLRGPGSGVWMTTMPSEMWQMARMAERARAAARGEGYALVAGLGLGVLTNLLAADSVETVTVEVTQEIIELCSPFVTPTARQGIIQADIHGYLASREAREASFAVALLDTWAGTGEHTWIQEVVPMRRAARVLATRVHAWLEEEMWGQVAKFVAVLLDVDVDEMPREFQREIPGRVFWRAHPELRREPRLKAYVEGVRESRRAFEWMVEAEHENLANPQVRRAMSRFFDAGGPEWERRYGELWDEEFEAWRRVSQQSS